MYPEENVHMSKFFYDLTKSQFDKIRDLLFGCISVLVFKELPVFFLLFRMCN